jgi:amidase
MAPTRRDFLELAGAATLGGLMDKASTGAREGLEPPIHYRDAIDLLAALRSKQISAVELMESTLERIAAVNPIVNALVSLVPPEQARAQARAADAAIASGAALPPLHGLPFAVKDLALTRGLRTTFGSPIFKDFVPDQDELFVERLRAAGAIVIGKTNTPEFGAGSQTFNPVFGATRNPYDPGRTAGGSSGGAAAALASGMLALADGSDLGGSLRNPAAFCNVIGFRPSPGRVPAYPSDMAWNTLPVIGPMARTVRDAALLLSVMAGPDDRDPISIEQPGALFLAPLERNLRGVRIAWTPDLGRYPVEPAVVDVCRRAVGVLEELGCEVAEDSPDMSGADWCFNALRGELFALRGAELLEHHAAQLKDTVVWNIRVGLGQTAADVARARAERTVIYHRMREFLTHYEYLVLPATQVAPFDVDIDWVREINGRPMQSYLDWMGICYAITLTGLPAISVPAGFTPEGMPVGLQIVGRHHADLAVLRIAHALEQASGHGRMRPRLDP